MIKGSRVLVTGGTGSFGTVAVQQFLNAGCEDIVIFSRDEKKQFDMRSHFVDPRIKFHLGDVRDGEAIARAIEGIDYVFHAAALKQVPSCEFFPSEAIKTNVIGTQNVLRAAIGAKVKAVVCLSTDKAVYPVNAMGMTKALMEKVAASFAAEQSETRVCITRYGNVIGSRGSVIPLFLDQIQRKIPLTITDPGMTRFLMSLDEALELVLFALEHGSSGDLYVQKSPAASMRNIADAVKRIANVPDDYAETNIGVRNGEKIHEVLLSSEEMRSATELNGYYVVPMAKDSLKYSKYFDEGKSNIKLIKQFDSNNTQRIKGAVLQKVISSALKSSGGAR